MLKSTKPQGHCCGTQLESEQAALGIRGENYETSGHHRDLSSASCEQGHFEDSDTGGPWTLIPRHGKDVKQSLCWCLSLPKTFFLEEQNLAAKGTKDPKSQLLHSLALTLGKPQIPPSLGKQG